MSDETNASSDSEEQTLNESIGAIYHHRSEASSSYVTEVQTETH